MTVALPRCGPLDLPITRPFWDAAAEGVLRMPRCGACRAWRWHPTMVCPTCHDAAPLQWKDLSGLATVFSYTRVHRAFVPSDELPYVVGLVVPDQTEGLRLVAPIVSDATPTIGGRVEARFHRMETHAMPYFVPVVE